MVINLTPNPYILNEKIWVWGYANADLFNRKAFSPKETTLIVPRRIKYVSLYLRNHHCNSGLYDSILEIDLG
jgi:hypothetical protein